MDTHKQGGTEETEYKAESSKKRRGLSSFQIIILGYAGMILLGALLLMLPFASQSGRASFSDAIFTSTSAVCVTGLVVQDTATYWSAFGQAVILVLLQIGGLGVITVAVAFALLSGRKISLRQRSTMQEAISAPKVGGIVRLTGFILRGSLIIEAAGILALLPMFIVRNGAKGIWQAVFHSISAFCNAGFDVMGTPEGPYQSLTGYAAHPGVNIVIMLLIVIGGIGFLTWDDIRVNKFHLRRYRMQSKVILTATALLLTLPAVFLYCFEYTELRGSERVLASLFTSVTTRTAGFNTTNLAELSSPSQALVIVLMLVGGSPGGTAGGMKTTTLAVLLASAVSVFRHREDTQFFGRRIDAAALRNACTLLMMYVTLFFTGGLLISVIENLPVGMCLFETASAVGTVGLSLGITSGLSIASRIVLMVLMFFGRVGGLTLIYAAGPANGTPSRLPLEKISVG